MPPLLWKGALRPVSVEELQEGLEVKDVEVTKEAVCNANFTRCGVTFQIG